MYLFVQNNNRGGYNAGDTDETNGFQSEEEIYNMVCIPGCVHMH